MSPPSRPPSPPAQDSAQKTGGSGDDELLDFWEETQYLEKLIEEDKKRFGEQPTPPRPTRGKGRGK